jgi:hypothetical protein
LTRPVFDREPVFLRWCMPEGISRDVGPWSRILSVIGHPLPCNYAFQMQNCTERNRCTDSMRHTPSGGISSIVASDTGESWGTGLRLAIAKRPSSKRTVSRSGRRTLPQAGRVSTLCFPVFDVVQRMSSSSLRFGGRSRPLSTPEHQN